MIDKYIKSYDTKARNTIIDTQLGYKRVSIKKLNKYKHGTLKVPTLDLVIQNKPRLTPDISNKIHKTPLFKTYYNKIYKTPNYKLLRKSITSKSTFNHTIYNYNKYQEVFSSSTCFIEVFSSITQAQESFNE